MKEHLAYWARVAAVYAAMVVAYGVVCHALGMTFQVPVVVITGIGVIAFGVIDVVRNGPVYRLALPRWLIRLTRTAVSRQ